MKKDPADMGALLRRIVDGLCESEGITQAEVAKRSGLDPTSLNHSFRHVNCAAAVRAVCRAFGFHVEIVRNEE